MKRIVFNGAIFATGRKDGIPRCAEEIVKQLDRLEFRYEMEIVVPIELEFKLKNIKVTILATDIYSKGKIGAELWKQFLFIKYVNNIDCITVDLGMMLPFKRNDICSIYDCQPERYSDNYIVKSYSKYVNKIRLKQRKNGVINSRLIITDSEDAKRDIINFYNVNPKKIKVVYCAWQHFQGIEPDNTVFDKFPMLKGKTFFFSLGSRFKHKNTEWIHAAAEQNPNYIFVISGYNNVAAYSEDILRSAPRNVIYTGYLSDQQLKSLMQSCRAFIHPSFSEGFGMPPLEALSVGAELIISNSSCLPEIYENCAHYIEPSQYENINIDEILKTKIDEPNRLLEKYSWEKSAKLLLKYIQEIIEENI